MTTIGHMTSLMVAIAIVEITCGRAWVGNAYAQPSPLENYLKGHAEIGKSHAAIVAAQASIIANTATAAAAVAKAREDLENVRGMALENDLKATKAYFEKRKMHADYRAQHAPPRADKEELARRAKSAAPRTTAYHVDPVRGRIYWPSVLKREEFARQREQLDALFVQRKTQEAGVGSNFCRQTKALSLQMREELKRMVYQMAPAEYLAARRFLDVLAYEAQFAACQEGLAAG